jgi:HD superfamily phosphohydrolase
LAGVLHDIGHGPYSHLFDSVVKYDEEYNPKGIKGWEHEIAGLKLIDLLYEYVLKNKNE